MSVPSRKRSYSRKKIRKSVCNLAFKKKNLNQLVDICFQCQQKKMLHYSCLNCYQQQKKNGSVEK